MRKVQITKKNKVAELKSQIQKGMKEVAEAEAEEKACERREQEQRERVIKDAAHSAFMWCCDALVEYAQRIDAMVASMECESAKTPDFKNEIERLKRVSIDTRKMVSVLKLRRCETPGGALTLGRHKQPSSSRLFYVTDDVAAPEMSKPFKPYETPK